MLMLRNCVMNFPSPWLAGQAGPRLFWSYKPGAATLTQHVFFGPASDRQIKTAAEAYIRRALRPETGSAPGKLRQHGLSKQDLEAAARLILDRPIETWSTISDAALLKPLRLPAGYWPTAPLRKWVHGVFYGGYRDEKDRFARDIGLNMAQHVADLEAFFSATAAFARVPLLSDIHADPAAWPGAAIDLELLTRLRRDHMLLMTVARARMLAEYIRRRATDPLHERGSPASPRWQWQSTVCVESLVQPAINLTKLMALKIKAKADHSAALTVAVNSGRLYLDPRLVAWAEEIRDALALDLLLTPDEVAAQVMATSVIRDVAPLARLTPKQVRASLGNQDAVARDFGVSAPIAISVIAMQLALLDAQLAGNQPPGIPRELPAGVRSKTRRITTVLKAMSGAWSGSGNAQADPDNKAGTKLLNEALAELAKPGKAMRLRHLSLRASRLKISS